MKIIDKYILKRYLVTFSVMLIMFIPIGITIDVSEKVNKMIEKKIPLTDILVYYGDFTIYFANLLFPIFLFLSIIWFTSKLANNTEIIAILSSGISFSRFLRPFIYGAAIVSVFALVMGFFLVPKASKGFNDFRYQNLKGNNKTRETSDIFRQIKIPTVFPITPLNVLDSDFNSNEIYRITEFTFRCDYWEETIL